MHSVDRCLKEPVLWSLLYSSLEERTMELICPIFRTLVKTNSRVILYHLSRMMITLCCPISDT
ncbi:hypothetical protein DVH24_008957 [Malus domestica]|uniref:Uncharacterized protein n=1 Tax=Malus domestica TaxID=3750 RepID=A0A498JRE1_MALDO|nr:hypothetical protein DVH24_008957 [Malus domestica]